MKNLHMGKMLLSNLKYEWLYRTKPCNVQADFQHYPVVKYCLMKSFTRMIKQHKENYLSLHNSATICVCLCTLYVLECTCVCVCGQTCGHHNYIATVLGTHSDRGFTVSFGKWYLYRCMGIFLLWSDLMLIDHPTILKQGVASLIMIEDQMSKEQKHKFCLCWSFGWCTTLSV